MSDRRGTLANTKKHEKTQSTMAVESDTMEKPVQEEKPVMDTSDDDGTDSSLSQSSSSSSSPGDDDAPMLDFRNASEWANFVAGVVLLLLAGPPVGIVVFAAMVWEAIDRGFHGGFVDSGKELTGFLFAQAIPWLRQATHNV